MKMDSTEQQFIQLLGEHQKIIHKVCNLYMNHPLDKEDLFQEITLQAWKGYAQFKGQSKFSTWLYRVALNTAITYFKKERKQIQQVDETWAGEIADYGKEDNEQFNLMYKAISELSKIDKAIVMLYLDDLPYQEISEMLGISPNHVAVKMNRIKIKLKESALKYSSSL